MDNTNQIQTQNMPVQTYNPISMTLGETWKRIVGGLIDGGIVFFMYMVSYGIVTVFYLTQSEELLDPDTIASGSFDNGMFTKMIGMNILSTLVMAIFVILTYVFVYIISPSYIFKGQTLGKKILGLKVINQNGSEYNIGSALKRHGLGLVLIVCLFIPCLNIFTCCLGPIYILVNMVKILSDSMRKSLGDTLADTVVVER